MVAGVLLTGGVLIGGDRFVAAEIPATPASIVAVAPYRILDTRNGIGAPAQPVSGGQRIRLQVAGVGPVPSTATGVVLNLTGTQASEATYVSAWPSTELQSDASVLNLTPGVDTPNMVTLALGTDGGVNLFNFTGSVHLVADVAGYLAPGGGGGTAGPPGPPGPPGDPGVVYGTRVITHADTTITNMFVSTSVDGAHNTLARRAVIAVPELTQAFLDGGGTVSVDAQVAAPVVQLWSPLPFRQMTGIVDGARSVRSIEVRFRVGEIHVYVSQQFDTSDEMSPSISSTTLKNLPIRWVLRPGG